MSRVIKRVINRVPSSTDLSDSGVFRVKNREGETLLGVLEEGEQPTQGGITVVCHGYRNTKDSYLPSVVGRAVRSSGRTVVRFDFSGNGNSEGEFQIGNYSKEVEDLRAVVLYLRTDLQYEVDCIIGHSKAASVVLLYAATFQDVPRMVNVAGRYDMRAGIAERFGAENMATLQMEGRLELTDRLGKFAVTQKSLEERRQTDMSVAANIQASVLTVHGTADEVVPVDDARAYDQLGMRSHTLELIEGANHNFHDHAFELGDAIVRFLNDGSLDPEVHWESMCTVC